MRDRMAPRPSWVWVCMLVVVVDAGTRMVVASGVIRVVALVAVPRGIEARSRVLGDRPQGGSVAVHRAHDDRRITLRLMGSCALVASATTSRLCVRRLSRGGSVPKCVSWTALR